MDDKELLEKILDYFGIENQLKKLNEESVELLEAGVMLNVANEIDNIPIINKKGFRKHVIEEIVDVQIVLDQIKKAYDVSFDEENEIRKFKLNRTSQRIDDNYYKKKD